MIEIMATPFEDLSRVIQLSVAPVFLLSALGTFLGVLSARLGRVVDRTRVLNGRLPGAVGDSRTAIQSELDNLHTRRRLVNRAITAGTVAALLLCLVMVVAFIGYIVQLPLGILTAVLFILAMLGFIAALVWFLREVLLAASTVHIEGH